MTAGAGLVHEELHSDTFTRSGGELELVQLWVNLPAHSKMVPPHYQELRAADIPRVDLGAGHGSVRVIAGAFAGRPGPARTVTPVELWDVTLTNGGALPIALPATFTRLLLVLRGHVVLDGGHAVGAGELAQLPRGAGARTVHAKSADARCLLLAGEPIDEPLVGHGPFVMNTHAEIVAAVRDFQAGRMGKLPARTTA
jgi:hypothetical protein